MQWINFLHLYQPANSDAYHIKEATERSYYRLVRVLEKHPQVKFTLNITGCLFLRWEELGYADLIVRLKRLVLKGQVELVGSAAYHGLLPLLPKEEVISQIKEQAEILRLHFGQDFKPRGFFLPEMAYSVEVARIIKKLGYEWLILDEISATGKLNKIDTTKVYQDKNSGLKIIFRSRKYSNSYIPDKLFDFFETQAVVVTATDAELYGLRHEDPTAELEKVLRHSKLQTELLSGYIKQATKVEKIALVASNWEATEKDLINKKPYVLWQDPKNKLQTKIWELADLAQEVIKKYHQDDNQEWARWHLVRGLASCTFWWASGRDFSHNFGPYAWSPDEIERGLNELIRAIRSLHDVTTRSIKIKAEKMYVKTKQLIWEKHWRQHWRKN